MAGAPSVTGRERLGDLLTRWGLDPVAGLQLVGTRRLPATPIDPTVALVVLPEPRAPAEEADGGFAPAVAPGRHARPADPLATLRALYPHDHPVRRAGGPDATVGELSASDLAAPLLLAAVPPLAAPASPHALPWIAARLRAPDGCPWDAEQDHGTLRHHLLEETYEVYDALAAGSTPGLAEELGDLLLQVVLHAQYAAERGVFDLSDVYRAIGQKVIRRHPHVFGEARASTAAEVARNWERIKGAERNEKETPDEGPLAGISLSLPALAASQEMQGRAASLGYDWPDLEGVIDKIGEEAAELLEADDQAARAEEFGDLLLVIVNLGRKLGIDAEAALRAGNAKFRRRFEGVLAIARERGLELERLTLDELDELWDAVKEREREVNA